MENILWFVFGAFLGFILFRPLSQLMITWGCAFPMLHEYRGLDNYFDMDRLRRKYRIAILLNLLYLGVGILAFVRYAPQPMSVGFWNVLAFLGWLCSSRSGVVEPYITEVHTSMLTGGFVRPGVEPKDAAQAMYERILHPLEEYRSSFYYFMQMVSHVWEVLAVICGLAGSYFLFAGNVEYGVSCTIVVMLNSIIRKKLGGMEHYNAEISLVLTATAVSVSLGIDWLWCVFVTFCIGVVIRAIPLIFDFIITR